MYGSDTAGAANSGANSGGLFPFLKERVICV